MKSRGDRLRGLCGHVAAGAIVATLYPAGAAMAQDVPAKPQEVTAAPAIDDIIVTARKRDERLEDVPITIAVLDGSALAGQNIQRTAELQFAVPGFTVQNFETRATITLRGVGAQIAGGTSSVATHLNGVYQASSAAQLNRLFDVQRVEVLKGPQGTLYGRNSTGGALNVITNGPGKELQGDFSAGYGSYNRVRLDGALSVPLSTDWGIRFAGSYEKGDGQIFNRATGKMIGNDDFIGGRATLAGSIGAIDVRVFGQYTRDQDNRQPTLIPITTATAKPVYDYETTVFDSPTQALVDRRMWVAGLNLSGKFSDTVSWRSITGYLDYGDTSAVDVNPSVSASQLVIRAPQQAREYSQEFQVLYNTSRINSVLGIYYLSDRQSNQRVLTATPPGLLYYNSSTVNKTNSAAIFGDVSYNVTDKLTLNAGARLNNDNIRNAYTGRGLIDGASFDLSGEKTSATWKLGIQYKPQPSFMAFGTISTGFQSGFFQTRADAATGANKPDQVNPEKLTAYEVGFKWVLPERRGYFNLSGFYYDYTDLQVSIGGIYLKPDGTLDNTRPAFYFTSNAGKARIYGLDAQLTDIRILPNLKFDGSGEYLNATFLQYNTVTSTRVPISYRGNYLPRAPKWSGTAALTIDHVALADRVAGELRGEFNYRSRNYFAPDNAILNSQGPIGLFNASARIDFDGGKWALTATGRNLANRKFFDFYGGGNFANTGEFRTWEIGAKLRF